VILFILVKLAASTRAEQEQKKLWRLVPKWLLCRSSVQSCIASMLIVIFVLVMNKNSTLITPDQMGFCNIDGVKLAKFHKLTKFVGFYHGRNFRVTYWTLKRNGIYKCRPNGSIYIQQDLNLNDIEKKRSSDRANSTFFLAIQLFTWEWTWKWSAQALMRISLWRITIVLQEKSRTKFKVPAEITLYI
jgi:hypothetical protein